MKDEAALDRTLEAFARVLFDRQPSRRDLALLGGRAERGPDRFLLYRDLVRSRLRDLVATALPRTTAALGRARMDAIVDERLSTAPPRTRFFREVVLELVPERAPGFASDELPHADELARLELAQWRALWEAHELPATVEFDFAKIPVVHPGMIRLTLGWSVHRPELPLERGCFHVAVYRRRDHVVETRWMSEPLAAILDAWRRAESSAIDGVRSGLASVGREPTSALVDEMSGMLAELLERGGVLGSRP